MPATRTPPIELLEPRTLFATVPTGFVAELVAGGLSNPTAMEFAPDGRVFVTQQGGLLRVIKNGSLLPASFVSLTVDSQGERGLLGVAFDPNYASNRFVYVYHTVPSGTAGGPSHNRVTRFTADAANPDVAVAGSGVTILDLEDLSLTATNHNGGAIHFGPDGKLYVAVGENANGANAQTLANRLGKMLRVNADGSIPTDNPFYNTATGANRAIWALGLRNPYTFAFQPGTGKMHINDVGQNTWEEVNVGQAGANYGWSTIEGFRTNQTAPAGYKDPVAVYRHPVTGSVATDVGIAITGGAFYARPAVANERFAFSDGYAGDYFYADYGSGTTAGNWIRYLDAGTANSTLFLTGASNIVDLHVGPTDGALYYLERGNGGALQRVRNAVLTPYSLDLDTSSDTGVSTGDNVTRDDTPLFTGKCPANCTVHVFVDGAEVTSVPDSGSFFSVTLPSIADGQHQVTFTATTAAGGLSASSDPLTITIDRTAPTVAAAFQYQTAQRVHLQFSEDVRATLAVGDMALTPQRTMTLAVSGAAGAPTAADFAPAALLADGRYHAALAASSVTDVAGNPLAAGVSLDFFVMAADANRDATVDFNDLVPLAQNYNTFGGRTFAQGDYNYDGDVDFDDLALLAQRYNTALPAAPVAAIAPIPASATFAAFSSDSGDRSRPSAKALFSATPVVKPVVVRPRPAQRRA